jgi:hypothetical protein
MQRCHAATLNWPAPGAGAYGPHPGDRLASGESEQRECDDIEAIRRSMVALPQLCSLPPWPVTHVDYHNYRSNSTRTPSAPIVSDSPRRTPTSRK